MPENKSLMILTRSQENKENYFYFYGPLNLGIVLLIFWLVYNYFLKNERSFGFFLVYTS